MSEAIVIVGAGPAGLSCARAYRGRGGQAPVLILGEDPDPPYERPPLSKDFLRGEVGRDELPLEPPGFYDRHGIELRTGARVSSLDLEARELETADGERIGFGACVLACGSRPLRPDVPGIDNPRALTLRSIDDCERLRAAVEAEQGRRALVVGSGFIGCEAAISLAALGAQVTLATMEARPQEARLGAEVAERIEGWLAEAGVELLAGVELEAIAAGDPPSVALSGRPVEADLVLLALGIEQRGELAASAGIELEGERIPTDERMRTEIEGLLAVGDVALAHNAAADRRLPVEHWGEALRHGEIAGAVLADDAEERWDGAPGFWSGLGSRTIKQVAWGDGFDRVEVTENGGESFTARYVGHGELVGVLTHDADDDYEAGRKAVEARTSWR